MPRGQKTCSKCGTTTGPRSYTCKECGFSFDVDKGASKRNKKKKGISIDWRELQKGDFIKVISGSGPGWKLGSGEVEPMGYYGKFKVSSIELNGIHAYPADKKNSGHCFIYMGEKKITSSGMQHCPHKVRKLNHAPRITNPSMVRSMA